jgi:hypothetical protein
MINEKNVHLYCCEDINKIENYEQAIIDTTQVWDCHHKAEILPCGNYSQNDLKKYKLFYHQLANALIFLTRSDHIRLHQIGNNNNNYGKHFSNSHKRKISTALKNFRKNNPFSKEHRKKLSNALKNKPLAEETKMKLSESHKGEKNHNYGKKFSKETRAKLSASHKGQLFWNNGIVNKRARESPGPEWKRGRI